MGKALKILIIVTTMMTIPVEAKVVKVNAIGSSPKGQFVAIEEFGYKSGSKVPYSRIRVMNMWKNKYVDRPVYVLGKAKDATLAMIRKQALDKAIKKLKKFNINH